MSSVDIFERLADELTKRQFKAHLEGSESLYLAVENPDQPELNEHVRCRTAPDGNWCFWWPWCQPIGSVDDLEIVTDKIVAVLRSVEVDG